MVGKQGEQQDSRDIHSIGVKGGPGTHRSVGIGRDVAGAVRDLMGTRNERYAEFSMCVKTVWYDFLISTITHKKCGTDVP